MSLENAPDEVKLAVDLIMLLEENKVPARTVLAALEIIRRDYENKVPATCWAVPVLFTVTNNFVFPVTPRRDAGDFFCMWSKQNGHYRTGAGIS